MWQSPNVATVSIFMQLISAPELNKHEKTNPPESILNVVPCSVPLLMVNTSSMHWGCTMLVVSQCHFLKCQELNPVGQKYFTSLVTVMQASLGLDSLLPYWDL